MKNFFILHPCSHAIAPMWATCLSVDLRSLVRGPSSMFWVLPRTCKKTTIAQTTCQRLPVSRLRCCRKSRLPQEMWATLTRWHRLFLSNNGNSRIRRLAGSLFSAPFLNISF